MAHTVPPAQGDPMIEIALHAILTFADDVNQEQAGRLLDMWTHRRLLTAQQVAQVVRQFPAADMAAEHDGLRAAAGGGRVLTGGGMMISGPMND